MALQYRIIKTNLKTIIYLSTIDTPPGMPCAGVSTNPEDQTDDPFGKFERKDLAQNM